jgi:HEPN domain-containing protein
MERSSIPTYKLTLMIKKYGQAFYRIGNMLATYATALVSARDSIGRNADAEVLDDENREFFTNNLTRIMTYCEAANLTFTAKSIQRILDTPREKLTYQYLVSTVPELERRFVDELDPYFFLFIPESKVKYYDSASPFGEEVTKKFPKATEDIDEAGKCYAVGRYTACVFHLMRVMEIGVQSLGKKLGISKPTEREWQPILNDVNGAIRKLSNPPTPITAKQKKVRNNYAQAAVYLENVKNAWRNDVMHPKATYTDEEAEEVFRTVKVYMQYLAKIL